MSSINNSENKTISIKKKELDSGSRSFAWNNLEDNYLLKKKYTIMFGSIMDPDFSLSVRVYQIIKMS